MKAKSSLQQSYLLSLAFLLSAAMLAYEILLTRIAAVLLTNQYVFLILGTALLGIAAGAVGEYYFAILRPQTSEVAPGLWLALSAGALTLALILSLQAGAEHGLSILAVSSAVPFAVSGFVFSRLFRLFTAFSGSLYAADLAGAAAGALSVPLLLPAFGPVQAILILAATLTSFGGVLTIIHNRGWQTLVGLVTAMAVVGLFLLNRNDALLGQIPVGKNPDKDLYRLTQLEKDSTTIIDSRWSTFGRTDLVRFARDPSLMSLFVDGAAGANMLGFNGNLQDSSTGYAHAVTHFGGLVPLLNLQDNQKDNALIIGPGGGRDVLLALKAGFRKITAVEINPKMVQIVNDYRDFNGGIYTNYANVEVVVAEGRSYLRNSQKRYDLITLFMPITKSSRSLNAFALSESYLFTKEAFRDYHRHLTEEGSLLVMAHSMPEVIKTMTTAIEALQEEGLTLDDAMTHLYILGSNMMPLFGMRKTPIQPDESEFLHAAAHYTMFDCQYSYIPGVEQQLLRPALSSRIDTGVPMMNPLFIDLAAGSLPLAQLERGTGFNLAPATDNQPFFFQYDFGLPGVILTVLWLSLAALAVVLFVPAYHLRLRQRSDQAYFSWWLPAFFVAIGVGYIVLELNLFQKLVFYLGDPARSLALLLAALLVGSSVGSFVSRKATRAVAVMGGLVSAGVALLILAIVPMVFSTLRETTLMAKQSIATLILFLQGIPMGFMFPIGLRLAERYLGKTAVPWMWAINGAGSVLGSALAIAIAMLLGYTWSLALGAACYLLAAVCIGKMPTRRES